MRTPKSLQGRIELLERGAYRLGDAEIMAWSKSVTDEELQRVVDETDRYLAENGGPEPLPLRTASEPELWRIIRPYVEAFRSEAGEGKTR